jgi:hypothetical protein
VAKWMKTAVSPSSWEVDGIQNPTGAEKSTDQHSNSNLSKRQRNADEVDARAAFGAPPPPAPASKNNSRPSSL